MSLMLFVCLPGQLTDPITPDIPLYGIPLSGLHEMKKQHNPGK